MMVYLNGRFVSEERAMVSIHDRGFLYGDGLFETIRVYDREPFLWADHSARFEHGCAVLQIRSPLTSPELRRVVRELARRNDLREGLIRVTLTRGCGARGYSPRGADDPTLVIAAFPAPGLPEAYRVILSRITPPDHDPLADLKHLNKLHQIMAKSEADLAGAHEALLANSAGFVIEGATTNVFWVKDGIIGTPPLRGILAGTTRAHVIRLCNRLRVPVAETNIRPRELKLADGVFVTSCAAEIREVSHLNGEPLKRSARVRELQAAYRGE
jgi:aminodeoxychorismate lyase